MNDFDIVKEAGKIVENYYRTVWKGHVTVSREGAKYDKIVVILDGNKNKKL